MHNADPGRADPAGLGLACLRGGASGEPRRDRAALCLAPFVTLGTLYPTVGCLNWHCTEMTVRLPTPVQGPVTDIRQPGAGGKLPPGFAGGGGPRPLLPQYHGHSLDVSVHHLSCYLLHV